MRPFHFETAHLRKVGNARRLEKHGHRALSKLSLRHQQAYPVLSGSYCLVLFFLPRSVFSPCPVLPALSMRPYLSAFNGGDVTPWPLPISLSISLLRLSPDLQRNHHAPDTPAVLQSVSSSPAVCFPQFCSLFPPSPRKRQAFKVLPNQTHNRLTTSPQFHPGHSIF